MAITEKSSGSVGSMSDMGPITIPPHGRIVLSPGKGHLMLERPAKSLRVGDRVLLTLSFTHAGAMHLELPVVPLTGPTSAGPTMTGM